MCKTCEKFAGWRGATSERLTDFATIDYYDGSTLALARCRGCAEPLLLSVLAWNPPHRDRVFAICPIPGDVDLEVRQAIQQWNNGKPPAPQPTQAEFDRLARGLIGAAGQPRGIILTRCLEQTILQAKQPQSPAPQLLLPEEVCSESLLDGWRAFFAHPEESI